MKTGKTSSVDVIMKALLVSIFLTLMVCSCKHGNTEREKRNPAVLQTKPQAPGIAIHIATLLGNMDAIRQHIEADADLNEKDEYGSTPLIIATVFDRTEVAETLIEAGADVNCTNNDGATPLHMAAFFCRTRIVEVLLENGADKNIRNKYGSTALESVSAPFSHVKSIYDQISEELGPLRLKLDYQRIEKNRPAIARMLR